MMAIVEIQGRALEKDARADKVVLVQDTLGIWVVAHDGMQKYSAEAALSFSQARALRDALTEMLATQEATS